MSAKSVRWCRMGFGAVLVGALLPAPGAQAGPAAEPAEMRQKAAWWQAHLLKASFGPPRADPAAARTAAPEPGLDVLANNDPVIPNVRGGHPLKIGDTTYARGLYCHAVSKVVVRLPGPGRSFSAVVGLDHNDDTARGKGSVVFSVQVGDTTAFRSEVMRFGTPARDVNVDLGGADSFVLEVGDAGDGIGWDQCDWAEAKVVLNDDRVLWLGDMPLRDRRTSSTLVPVPRNSSLPFSFIFGGRESDDLLAAWPVKTEERALERGRKQRVHTWSDPKTGLEVRCVAVDYSDFPAAEWTVYFKNAGQENTPILENIAGLDLPQTREPSGEFTLHHWKGDTCAPDLYQPLDQVLAPASTFRFAPAGGRGSNGAFPYYNLQRPGGGLMLAIGWPGQWASAFIRDSEHGLRLLAGQGYTHLSLKPGEEIRAPLIALLFWQGEDLRRAHNLWRRWMFAHNVPRTADGKLPPPILFGNTSLEFNEMIDANEENQKYFIDRYVEERVGIDYWWMDAGWYPCGGQWPNTGTWEPDTNRFPRGLRAISDHGLRNGVKTLVWFEPERVAGGTWIARNHPEWLLGPLLNLGLPAARQWLTDHVDRVLREQGIHLYRQDFNMDPLGCWRGNDAPDRQGISENLHVQGYLAYWDELRRRHPQLIIDSCASGGRRNDLETMRRAIALHPTDYNYGHLAVKQAFHHSLFHWLPDFGSNTIPIDQADPYAFRSGHAMNVVLGYDLRRKDLDGALLRKMAGEWRAIAPCYYGDYYALTPYSIDETRWLAWQFNRPEEKDGIVEAFRRGQCEEATATFRLAGLDPDSRYDVSDPDSGTSTNLAGKVLMEQGLTVGVAGKARAALRKYRALN